MTFYKTFKLVLILAFCFTSSVGANDKASFTIILSADMPDISEKQTGLYPQLRQLVLTTNKTSDSVFFIFGGGSIGPSAMSSFDRGSHIIDILNSVEPDVMGVTKREFSYFEDQLSLRAYEAAFPIVISNAIDTRTNQVPDGLTDSVLIKKGALTMGFLSIVNSRLVEEYLLKNIQVNDPQEVVKQKAINLRQAGADFVVLHYSYPFEFISDLLDNKIVDIGLLSDTRLQKQYYDAVHLHPHNFLIAEPGQAVVANFTLHQNLELISDEQATLANLNPNPDMQEQVNHYILRLNRLLDERIGNFSTPMSTRREDVRAKENLFANFVTDSMRRYAGADIALINGGSIRGDRTYNQGSSITQRTIATELPFRSRLKVIEVMGLAFKNGIEAGLSEIADLKGGFPHVSGAEIIYDSTKPVGSRVISVKVNNAPLIEDKLYLLATTDYLAQGGDGLTDLMNARDVYFSVSDNPILISDLVTQSIRLNGTIVSNLERRIVDASLAK